MKNKDIILCGYRLILTIVLDSIKIIYSQISLFCRLKNIILIILNSQKYFINVILFCIVMYHAFNCIAFL
jgi:hypothetical protein